MPNKYEIITVPNKGKLYKVSIWGNIKEYEDYDKLLETLDKITEEDCVELRVSTPGGRCDIGFTIFDRIVHLPCEVKVIVPYPTYSMGAILALSGNSLEIKPGAFMMFNDYSTGSEGKGNEIFNDICQPFLTKKE